MTEVIRLDEEPVLKTGGGHAACGFESHGFRHAGTKIRVRSRWVHFMKHGPVA